MMDNIGEAITSAEEIVEFLQEVNKSHGEWLDPPDMEIQCDVDDVGLEGFCELEEAMEVAQDLLNALLGMKKVGNTDA